MFHPPTLLRLLKIKVIEEYSIYPCEMSSWQEIPIEGIKIYGFLEKEKAS